MADRAAQWLVAAAVIFGHATAIFTKEQANILYAEMKSKVKSFLGLSLNVPTGLALVDRVELAKVIERQTGPNIHHALENQDLEASKTLGLYVRRGMRRGLYIQAGLPKLLFLQVAGHEFAHASTATYFGDDTPRAHGRLTLNPIAQPKRRIKFW